GLTGQLMHDFRYIGTHPRAFAGSENDDCESGTRHGTLTISGRVGERKRSAVARFCNSPRRRAQHLLWPYMAPAHMTCRRTGLACRPCSVNGAEAHSCGAVLPAARQPRLTARPAPAYIAAPSRMGA